VVPYLGRAVSNYARRQQYRRCVRAGKAALGSAVLALLGLAVAVAAAGAAPIAGLLLVMAIGLGINARHWLSLAGRSRVGARSEDEVQRALAALEAEGWRLRHSLSWQGQGDIDSVGIAPTGIAIAIETKCQKLRHAASHPRARPGGVVGTTPAPVGGQRRSWRHVPRPCAGRRTGRGRRSGGLDRPLDAHPPGRGGHGSGPALKRLIGRSATSPQRPRRLRLGAPAHPHGANSIVRSGADWARPRGAERRQWDREQCAEP